MMDIQEKEVLIAEIERFKEEAMKSYVVSCWAESYTNTDPFGYVVLENENNKVWWLKTQAYELWCFWQAAKAQAVQEIDELKAQLSTEKSLRSMCEHLINTKQDEIIELKAKAQVVPEELIEKLEAAANFMRGMCFDPKVPAHAKEALKYRYEEIEAMIEAQEPAND